MMTRLAIWAVLLVALCAGPSIAQLTLTGAGKKPGAAGATVTFDAVGSGVGPRSGASVTTFGYTDMTISGGLTDPGVVAVVKDCGAASISSVTAVWDLATTNQTMTPLGSVSSGAGGVFLFGRRNPTSGAKILTLNWTTASQVTVQMISFSNVNQSSDGAAFSGFDSATNAAPISKAITSGTTSKVVGGFVAVANFTSTTGVGSYIDNSCAVNAAASNYDNGAASVTLTGSPGSAVLSAVAGISVNP